MQTKSNIQHAADSLLAATSAKIALALTVFALLCLAAGAHLPHFAETFASAITGALR